MNSTTPSALSGRNWRLVAYIVIFCGLLAAYWFAHQSAAVNGAELPYDQFNHRLDNGQIYEDDKHPLDLLIAEGNSVQTLTGFYSDLLPAKDHLDRLQPFRTTISSDHDQELKDRLKNKGLTPTIRVQSHLGAATWLSLLPLFVFAVVFSVLLWVFRRLLAALTRRPDPAAPR